MLNALFVQFGGRSEVPIPWWVRLYFLNLTYTLLFIFILKINKFAAVDKGQNVERIVCTIRWQFGGTYPSVGSTLVFKCKILSSDNIFGPELGYSPPLNASDVLVRQP